MEIKVSLFQFEVDEDTFIQPRKLRGYVGCTFPQEDMVHNHLQDEVRYDYPCVQFKIVDSLPTIVCFGEGTNLLQGLFFELDTLQIGGRTIPVYERTFRTQTYQYGDVDDTLEYRFISPWLPLNQQNYRSYQQLSTHAEKKAELERILIGNVLSQAKGLGYWVENDLKVDLSFRTLKNSVRYKGNRFQGFRGSFKLNFPLPDYLGIGKGVSRGYGAVELMSGKGDNR